jgi:hypothetical protein
MVWPAASTFGNILSRAGLTSPQKKRKRTTPCSDPFSLVTGPNQLWCMDFKGYFTTGGDPFTITDAHSRYLIRCNDQTSQNHVAWVTEVLKKMQTVLPGITREALCQVFTTEGGLSTGLQRTFVSCDCPYFKVDVEFQAVVCPDRNGNGRVTLGEDGKDLILKISRPYLQFSILD